MSNSRKKTLADLIALNAVDGVGIGRMYALLDAFGSAGSALDASISELTDVPGIGREIASAIKEKQDRDKASAMVGRILDLGWSYFMHSDAGYPEPLKSIPERPPYIFYLGDYTEADLNAIAIVGSRTATEEGRSFAESLALRLEGRDRIDNQHRSAGS